MSRLCRATIIAQGVYYGLTGVWPLVSLSTFEAVTGPKTDDWLVQTVGALVVAIAVALLAGARRQVMSGETLVLAAASAVAFTCVDLVFALSGTISPIYLGDAVVQVGLLVMIGIGWRRQLRGSQSASSARRHGADAALQAAPPVRKTPMPSVENPRLAS